MNSLKGILKRNNEGLINIKFNKEIDGELFYKTNMSDEEKRLFDFSTDEIGFFDPDKKNRTFYIVRTKDEVLELAERLVPFKDFCNFRDIGGYYTEDGRIVKWGNFYRSESLSELKDDDLYYFKTLGIKYVFDYRSEAEVKAALDVQVDGIENINISAMAGYGQGNENLDMQSYVERFAKGEEKISPMELLKGSYKELPFNNKAYKELMEKVRHEGNTAILQHCTAGKDRTGIGAALILLLLGVNEKTVIKDYLDSNYYRKKENQRIINQYSKMIPNKELLDCFKNLLGVSEGLILEALNAIKEKYGSYENYFLNEYGMDKEEITKIRNMYLK